MFGKKSNGAIAATLIFAVFLWGGSNAATKFLMGFWPPVWIGSTRFLCAGFMLLGLLRWTRGSAGARPLSGPARRDLWLRGGLSLAVYIVAFNWALHYTTTSHVALYLGASPVWTLLWEERPAWSMRSAQRYGAAGIALLGVVVLFWPALRSGSAGWRGELLGVTASVMWANYGRQCRRLSGELSGAELSAQTMWRAGLLLLPVALLEVAGRKPVWRPDLVGAQAYCVVAGGVVAYALWNNALRQWPTSRVFLFNNLIPLSTMAWAWACLGEPITRTFWAAMILVVAGVVLGQARGVWFMSPRRAALE